LALVNTKAALGRTIAQAADAKIAETSKPRIARAEILINGNQAIVVDGLSSQDSWRIVFIARHNRLFTLGTFAYTG